MDIYALKEFLIDANKHTYSTGNESLNKKETDKSTTIQYEKGLWRFDDNFFGGEPYGGREVVFFMNDPVWIMVYYGSVDDSCFPKIIYPVLQKALRHMPEKAPFRGPKELVDGEYVYHNVWTGTVDKFSGKEIISKNGKAIYEAMYLGGLVDEKRSV